MKVKCNGVYWLNCTRPQGIFSLFTIRVTAYVEFLKANFSYKLRQVLFDVREGNSNLAKSPSEKSNHAMYQEEDLQTGLLSL